MDQARQIKHQITPSAADYLQEILRAPVYEVAQISPLQSLPRLSQRLGHHIHLKREDRQPVHSFKLRGAYNMMSQLSDAQKSQGVIAASAGNHAQGVALAGQKLGISTCIVMPRTTPDIKVDSVRRLGGQVILHGNNFDEAKIKANQLAEEKGFYFIPPFDHPAIIAGQGTVGLEILQQNAHLDVIFLPVGGGGLAAGMAVLIKQLMPQIKLIGVEAEDSACLKAALDAGKPVILDTVGTFADGVAVKCIGAESFRLCQRFLDEVITVSSDEICAAIKDIFEDTRAISEPAGAVSLAGLKRYCQNNPTHNQHLAAILSGANTNFHSLRYISERAGIGEKREGLLAVTIPEKTGAFYDFYQIIGGRAVTEFNYRHDQHHLANIFVGLRLVRGQQELEGIIQDLRQAGYPVQDLSDDDIAKEHIRYMIGGRSQHIAHERLYNFEFPEYPGALLAFLNTLGTRWNISLFNYRNQGADYGRVLCGFDVEPESLLIFTQHLRQLGYQWKDVTQNPAYDFFLKKHEK